MSWSWTPARQVLYSHEGAWAPSISRFAFQSFAAGFSSFQEAMKKASVPEMEGPSLILCSSRHAAGSLLPAQNDGEGTVSYTHLTLPTSDLV